ncbi:MFS transporter [Tomitella biformata]|uniref:MFS transporter n=1 Tax=Tomitella biformata TaxID=630403 RepID=UPI000464E9B8|nr:MFS transporter [Tomitella biformata]
MSRVFADTTPLQNPHFRRLWTAEIITVIGAQMTVVAVPAQIYGITGSSAYVGLAGLFGLVPLIVFGLWGGALADAMDRRSLMMITTVGLCVTALAFWAQAFLGIGNVWVVLGLFSVQQAFFAVNSPTRAAIYPRLLPFDQLPAANSLHMTVMQFGAIVGPLSGGVLLATVGLSWLYLIDSVFLFATFWAVFKLPALAPGAAAVKAGLRSVIDGFRYLAGHKVLLASFIVDIIAMVFGMPRALFPQMAEDSFGGPEGGGAVLGLLFAAMSIGAVLGGVFSGWLPRVRRQGLAVLVAIVLWGLTMLGFGLAAMGGPGWLWVALGFLALGGAADMVSAAFRSTMLQQVAADEVRGRLQGVFVVVVAGGPRIGDVAHGAAAYAVGTTVAAAGGGVLVVVGVVIAGLALPAFIRYRVTR